MSTGYIEYRDRSDMTEDELAEADAEVAPPQKRGRGRPALGAGLKRTELVKLYVRPDEREEMTQKAQSHGLSLSEYLRRRGLGRRMPTK